ncbi:TPA_asm: polyprotein [Paris polyphylla secovirus 2]|nr:TPA_asm: polyprotein [Paris polyphylla secovirus 2]
MFFWLVVKLLLTLSLVYWGVERFCYYLCELAFRKGLFWPCEKYYNNARYGCLPPYYKAWRELYSVQFGRKKDSFETYKSFPFLCCAFSRLAQKTIVAMAARTTTVPFTGSSVVLGATDVQANHLSAAELRERQPGMREATEARSTVLPQRSDVFRRDAFVRRMFERVSQGARPAVTRVVERPVGVSIGSQATDAPIVILEREEAAVVDDRMGLRARSQATVPNQFVRVGAMEVVIDGVAGPGTDAVQAVVLYDSRHQRNTNAVRAAIVASAAAVPTRVVVYPELRIPLCPQINDHLRVAMVSPDSDMGGNIVAVVRAGLVFQIDGGSHEERITVGQLRHEVEDRQIVAQYRRNNCVVIEGPQQAPLLSGRISVPLAPVASMRHVGGTSWVEDVHPRGSVDIDLSQATNLRHLVRQGATSTNGEEVRNERQNQDCYGNRSTAQAYDPFVMQSVESGIMSSPYESDRIVFSTTCTIPLTATSGKVLGSWQLRDMMMWHGKASQSLALAISCQKKFLLKCYCKIPPLSAVGLMLVYGEAEVSKADISIKAAASLQHTIWNPASSNLHEWQVDPCGTGEWSPVWLEGLQGAFNIILACPWSNPPKTEAVCTISVYISDENTEPRIYKPLSLPTILPVGRLFGSFTVEQGIRATAERFELSIGSPIVVANGLCSTFQSSLLSFAAYWKADVVIRLTRVGSSFVGATLGCAYLSGRKVDTITRETCETVPNVQVVVDDRASSVQFLMPAELMGWAYASERLRCDAASRRGRGLSLAIWVRDAVTAVNNDKLIFTVECHELRNLRTWGGGFGYPWNASRFQTNAVRWFHVASYASTEQAKTVECTVTFGTSGLVVTGTKGAKIALLPNPLSLLLSNCVWARGPIWYRAVWFPDEKKNFGSRAGGVSGELWWNGVASTVCDRFVGVLPSGDNVLQGEIVGPNNGFAYLDGGMRELAIIPAYVFRMCVATHYSGFSIMVGIDETFEVSGARTGTASVVADITEQSEIDTH